MVVTALLMTSQPRLRYRSARGLKFAGLMTRRFHSSLDVSLSGVSEVFVTKDDYDPKSTLNNSRDTAYYMFAQAGIVVTLCGKRIRPVVSKPQK